MEKSKKKSEKKDKLEMKRMSRMTDSERMLEDEELAERAKNRGKSEGKEVKFMQRYQHKGAFYMDESEMDDDDVRKRDYHLHATGDGAHVNVKNLPKVMQVRNFGRKGQSKYTHLADQDTSTRDSLAIQGMSHFESKKRRHGGETSDNQNGRKRR